MSNKISVIVPVYKVEKYLDTCIQSVLNQTYKNFELLLIDDGSPDKCGEICEKYANSDDRVKVYHKKNGGLSDARNYGIDRATGEYLTFIDSDDKVTAWYLEILLKYALKYDADVVQAKATRVEENLSSSAKVNNVIEYTGRNILKHFLLFQNVGVEAWCKLYKRKCFYDIRFPVGKLHEDNQTTYKIYANSERFILVDNYVYYYRPNANGITGDSFDPRRFSLLEVPKQIKKYLGDRADEYNDYLEYYKIRINIYLYTECIYRNAVNQNYSHIKLIQKNIKSTNIHNHYLEQKYKIIIILMKINPKLYEFAVRYIRKNELN